MVLSLRETTSAMEIGAAIEGVRDAMRELQEGMREQFSIIREMLQRLQDEGIEDDEEEIKEELEEEEANSELEEDPSKMDSKAEEEEESKVISDEELPDNERDEEFSQKELKLLETKIEVGEKVEWRKNEVFELCKTVATAPSILVQMAFDKCVKEEKDVGQKERDYATRLELIARAYSIKKTIKASGMGDLNFDPGGDNYDVPLTVVKKGNWEVKSHLDNSEGGLSKNLCRANPSLRSPIYHCAMLKRELDVNTQKQEIISYFLREYQLSNEEIIALGDEDLNENFFKALPQVQEIHANCKVLLRTHSQHAGLELMDVMAVYQGAYERLCRWVQAEYRKLGDTDNPKVSDLLKSTVRSLKDGHVLFEYCAEQVAIMRHILPVL